MRWRKADMYKVRFKRQDGRAGCELRGLRRSCQVPETKRRLLNFYEWTIAKITTLLGTGSVPTGKGAKAAFQLVMMALDTGHREVSHQILVRYANGCKIVRHSLPMMEATSASATDWFDKSDNGAPFPSCNDRTNESASNSLDLSVGRSSLQRSRNLVLLHTVKAPSTRAAQRCGSAVNGRARPLLSHDFSRRALAMPLVDRKPPVTHSLVVVRWGRMREIGARLQ